MDYWRIFASVTVPRPLLSATDAEMGSFFGRAVITSVVPHHGTAPNLIGGEYQGSKK